MATGWLWDERYMWHDTGYGAGPLSAGGSIEPGLAHAEAPETKRRFRNLVETSGLLARLEELRPRPATDAELLRLHVPEYLARIRALSADRGGFAGEITPFGPGSFEVAALAVGGAITTVDAVLDGTVDNAYALIRPPGHHAEAAQGRGYCIFANGPLAVLHARAARGVGRVAVIDWDVHHGNGAETAFYEDPDVLTVSVHGEAHYPADRGVLEHTGRGAGEGTNLNIPLPHGSGMGAYVAAFERVIAPAIRAFRPELLLVACGFDASALDPAGRQLLHSDAFRRLTELTLDVAAEVCDGRVAMLHEGGYSAAYVPFCGLAVVEALSGVRTDVVDPFLEDYAGWPAQRLQPHQEQAIAAAEHLVAGVPRAAGDPTQHTVQRQIDPGVPMPQPSSPSESRTAGLVDTEARYRDLHPGSERVVDDLAEAMPGGDTRTTAWYPPFPLVVDSSSGAVMRDVDGNEVVDFIGNYTALIHGHSAPFIVDAISRELPRGVIFASPMREQGGLAAALTARVPSVELVRFTNSGTEANLLAARLARKATGRRTLAIAEHSYHGAWEGLDWQETAVTGSATFPINDIEGATAALDAAGPLAAIFIEPVLGSGGVIPVDPGFLRFLREYATRTGALLVLDEVMTLRLAFGGLQATFGIQPDLTSFGKLIGGGLPVGAVGGSREVMELADPRRPDRLQHGGTFNGHRLAMVAGVATLDALSRDEIDRINGLGVRLATGIESLAEETGAPVSVTSFGSMLNLHAACDVQTPEAAYAAARSDLSRRLHLDLINHGVFMAARGEMCISTAMDDETIDRALEALRKVLQNVTG